MARHMFLLVRHPLEMRILTIIVLLGHGSYIFMGQPAGIRLKGRAGIVATHNEVSHGPYGGILVGWQEGVLAPNRSRKP